MTDVKTAEEYLLERKERKERLKKTIAELQEELETLEPAPAPKWRGKMSKKDRVEYERRLIGRLLCDLNFGDVRESVAGMGISWRRFIDKQHQVIWRSLETLDTHSIEERMDILQEELLTKAREEDASGKNPMFKDGDKYYDTAIKEWVDILTGYPGSPQGEDYRKALVDGASDGLAWFIRGLEAAGALALAGGKVYLRELRENGNDFMEPKEMTEMLFGRKGE